MSTVMNTNPELNHLEQPMFFGEELGVARYESQKHSVFESLVTKQLSFFWRPEEIPLGIDRMQYDKLSPEWKIIFDSNLQYQTLLDTVQGRAPIQAFLDICSDVALENWITTWAFSETIHSRSYTHIQRNLHIEPDKEFDRILKNPAIMKRAASITKYYDDLIANCHELKNLSLKLERLKEHGYIDDHETVVHYKQKHKEQLRDCKVALYLCLHAVNALEAIRFYVSFSFTFNFAELGIMEGNAKIMRLIARDEALHQKSTQSIIRLMQMGKDDPEMAEIAYQYEEEATKIFMEVVEQEIEWAEHLFSVGEVDNISLKSTTAYVKHLADQRMRAVGLSSPFGITENPYPWMKKYLSSDTLQVAPQEVEVSSYLVGNLNTEISDESYSEWQSKYM
ncbi:ribonucleotide reductase B subunit [Yersinia phage JC221]|nr:ribonucleotide reductase B subunit [Yersinia phage JC221]